MNSITQCVRCFHRVCLGLTLLVALTITAQAHDPGLSTATVTVGDQQIDVLLGFARQDAVYILPANAYPADIETPEGFPAMRPELESATATGFNLYFGEQRVLSSQPTAQLKDGTNVEILLRFRRTNATQLRLLSTFLERFPF